ncbi:hypothetical protein B0H16DRAFT_1781234 [Mycena metata]|uniref:Zn(2)-C6 fungal-type domain-containing protein n=1 Tax=Mycena metata TaxID=1033252 RepID=A0AAD7JP34_9AGAR|nr:hypothetical protein B0H16DRAFT_1781234 [Mycena metata]
MSDSGPRPQGDLPAVFLNRRRVIIACTNCRKRKIRCLTSEETPENPCERCVNRGLRCKYITVTDQRGDSAANNKWKRESTSRRSASPNQSPPATSVGFDTSQWHGPRMRRSYSTPTVGHHPYAQYSIASDGYSHHTGGGYNAFAASTEFQGYPDPTRTLPPIAALDFGQIPAIEYTEGAVPYGSPDHAPWVLERFNDISDLIVYRCGVCPQVPANASGHKTEDSN